MKPASLILALSSYFRRLHATIENDHQISSSKTKQAYIAAVKQKGQNFVKFEMFSVCHKKVDCPMAPADLFPIAS